MAKALSLDLRERVVSAVDAGMSRRAAAERFGVGVSSAIRFIQRARERGDLTPDKRGGNSRSYRIDAHAKFIFGLVDAVPDLTLSEIGERLHDACGYRALPSVVHRFFARHAITRKKRPRTRPSRTV